MYDPFSQLDIQKSDPVILGIESSCDETAAAVIRGRKILSDEIASSANVQATFGGVVPEIASRAHTDCIEEVVERAVKNAGVRYEDIDAIAVTYGAGLLGALLVGVSFAKALAFALQKPLIAVNHIRGHLAAAYLDCPTLQPPFVTLLASGGHTAILHAKSEGEFEILGATLDDAAGEAFDKVARVLGLRYPGGPHIERCAAEGQAVVEMPKMEPGKYIESLAPFLAQLFDVSAGRGLVLFTAYDMMRKIANLARPLFDVLGLELFVQGEGLSREAMVARLKAGGRVVVPPRAPCCLATSITSSA